MKPSRLAGILKKIASRIEASKQPKKDLVVKDLKNVILAMENSQSQLTPSQLGSQLFYHDDKERTLDQAIQEVKDYCKANGLDQQMCDNTIDWLKNSEMFT